MKAISITGATTLKAFMMKTTVVVMSVALLSGIAHARSEKEWTGLYGGLNIGGIFNAAYINSHNLGFTRQNGTCNTNTYFASFFPGIQLGYARQLNNKVVLSIEGDLTDNFNNQGKAACSCETNPNVSDKFIVKNQQQGSVRGRIGYELNNHLLPFFMVGGSLANLGVSYRDEGGDSYATNKLAPGWLIGAGLEWHFAHDWSVRAEYFYADYNNALSMGIPRTYGLSDPNGNARVNLDANNIRAVINYWF
jgi:outer membrane immunogenic protein